MVRSGEKSRREGITIVAGAVGIGVRACLKVQVAACGWPALLGGQRSGALLDICPPLLQLYHTCWHRYTVTVSCRELSTLEPISLMTWGARYDELK